MNILLADDHLLTARLLKNYLSKKKYNILGIVSNGAEALKFIRHKEVDLVILDISMPVLDGIQTLRYLNNEQNNTKVVMLSEHSERWIIKKSFDLGAIGFIKKSSGLSEVDRILTNIKNDFEFCSN